MTYKKAAHIKAAHIKLQSINANEAIESRCWTRNFLGQNISRYSSEKQCLKQSYIMVPEVTRKFILLWTMDLIFAADGRLTSFSAVVVVMG